MYTKKEVHVDSILPPNISDSEPLGSACQSEIEVPRIEKDPGSLGYGSLRSG
jgi:hypothetical protein